VGDEIWVRIWEQPRVSVRSAEGAAGVSTLVPGEAGAYRLVPYDAVTVDVWSLPEPKQEGPEYRLRAGDLLRVSVWGVPELDRLVRVRPDGSFSYDLVGEVRARGRTVPEVRREL